MPRKPRKQQRNTALTLSDTRVDRAIRLLELLSSTEDSLVAANEAARQLACTDAQLDEAIELISALADRESGARAVIFRDHGDIVLAGDGAHLTPLRLSLGEGAVLAHVMGSLALDANVRDRLSRALLPLAHTGGDAPLVAGSTSFGTHYPALRRALEDHRRCRISYRSHGETAPRGRVVDPLSIDVTGDGAYLLAQDVEKNAPRRYRLERIGRVEVLDEPARSAACAVPAVADSLRASGTAIELEIAPDKPVPAWSGIEQARPLADGSTRFTVRTSSLPWLYDHVLAAGGAMRIIAPADAREGLVSYARSL